MDGLVSTYNINNDDRVVCGEDCGHSIVYLRDGRYWQTRWNGFFILAWKASGGGRSRNTIGFCPRCGRKLWFKADGTPAVGLSYDEQVDELKVLKMRAESILSRNEKGADCE